MNDQNIRLAAAALYEARASRQPIPPISERFGIRELSAAYAVAEVNTRVAVAEGRRISGKKVGLTSKAVQQQLGVDQPDFGVLFSDMELLTGAEIDSSRLIQPKAEGEVAFVVGRDLDEPELTWGRFLVGLEYALAAIEIVDSAIADWKITLADTVADNASCGLYVLGDQPRRLGELALTEVAMELRQNDAVAALGTGAACLGNPLNAAFWLARTMAELGTPLCAGDVILSGALGPMVPLSRGDRLEMEISGLGRVRCRPG